MHPNKDVSWKVNGNPILPKTEYIRSMWRIIFGIFLFTLSWQSVGQVKVSPNLLKKMNGRINVHQESEFVVTFESDLNVEKLPIKVISNHKASNSYVILTSWRIILELLESDKVKFVDLNRQPMEESALDDPNFEYNRIRTVQSIYPEFTGIGEIISIKERQFDHKDIDLVNKLVDVGTAADSESQHATDIATIIAGIGNTAEANKGIVPEANLSSSDFNNLLPDDESNLINNGISLQNHSYGVGIENYYGVEAAAYDQQVFEQPHLLHVFSAGNSGTSSPTEGTYSDLPFANLTGTFKQAKNIITVSAVDTSLTINELNSRGPAYDGRIKPELTAYGGRGTSDAAAIVSGISSLLQNAYQTSNGTQPDAALIKSILISSADDIGPKGIDYYTGYGSVNANKAMKVIKSNQFQSMEISKNQIREITLSIPSNVKQMQLALTWTDPPAELNANQALVNDLNSQLSNGSTTFLPWTLSSVPNANELTKRAQRAEDHLNNVEYFTIDNPEPGDYTLTIDASSIATSSQTVHYSWYFEELNAFQWDYPNSNSVLPANSKIRLYWGNTYDYDKATLSYQYNGQWYELESNVNLNHGVLNWTTPKSAGLYQLRMAIDGVNVESEEFLISETPDVTVAFNCADNFGLQWRSIKNSLGYEVYEMQEDSLRLIGSTSDTSFIVNKNTSLFYSVNPIYKDGSGLRNLAFNYAYQGAFCYFNFFSAQKADNQIEINLTLSSALNIESVVLLKEYDGVLDSLAQFDVVSRTAFQWIDTDLDPGSMDYYAYLQFHDGGGQYSDLVTVLVDDPGKVTFFPNPTEDIYIYALTSGEQLSLEISDRTGKIVHEETLLYQVNSINVEKLKAGVYVYRVKKDGKIYDQGRFIKF